MNDKLELQECLEHGRIAKVSPSVSSVGGRGKDRGQDEVELPPGMCLAFPLGLCGCS